MSHPVFVIGKNRSGTKWLTNTIASHENFCCVQREGANGVVETNILRQMPRAFGSLKDEENHVGFVECFSETNFFKLTGIPKEFLYNLNADSYTQVLSQVMKKYSRKKRWTHKFSPHVVQKIVNKFPKAKLIFIYRNCVENVKSSIGLENLKDKSEKRSVMRHLLSYVYQVKSMKKYSDRKNVMEVNFVDLKKSKKKLCKEISEFVGVKFSKKMLKERYDKNTSYISDVKKEEVLSTKEENILKITKIIVDKLPLTTLKVMNKVKNLLRDDFEKKRFVPKTFEIRRKEVK